MTVSKASDYSPVNLDEVRAGRYISDEECYQACQLACLVLAERTRILAYSAHHLPQEFIEDEWVYHFCVRIFSTEHEITCKVFGGGGASGVDWELYKVHPATNALTSLGTGTSTPGSPDDVTFTLSTSDLDSTDGWIRFQIHGENGATNTGDFLGFVMYENPASLVSSGQYDTMSFRSSGGIYMQDAQQFDDSRSINRIAQKGLLDMIQAVLSDRNPGCAIAYPRQYQPVIGSVFWRANGPYKMAIPSHCSKATMIIETYGFSTGGSVLVGGFSSDTDREFNQSFLIEENYEEVIAQTDPLTNGPVVINDIEAISGKVNNFWILFRSGVTSTDPIGQAAFQFEVRSLGICRFYTRESGLSSEMWRSTSSPFDPFPTPPYGYHVEIGYNTDTVITKDPGDVDAYWEDYAYPYTDYGLGSEGTYIYDYALIKHATGNDGVEAALSPCPDFTYPGTPDGGPKPEEDDRPSAYAYLHTHAYQFVCSVWINGEFDAGAGALGQGSWLSRTLPSSSNIRAAITRLNTVADNGLITPMMGTQVGRAMFDQLSKDVAFGWDPLTAMLTVPTVTEDVAWSDGCWRWIHLMTTKYENPLESSTYSRIPWRKVSTGVLVVPNGRTATERREALLKVSIDWLAMIISTRDDPYSGQKLKVQFAVCISENPTLNAWLDTYNIDEESILFYSEEVDWEGLIIKAEDIETHTEWAALQPLTRGGRSSTHVLPDGTQQTHGLQAATTQSFAWPQELLEDRYPFRTHEMNVDITDWLDDGAEPDEVYIHIFADFRVFQESGDGNYIDNPSRKILEGGLVVAGTGVFASKLEEA